MSESLPTYLDVEGNERSRKDWDYHHVIPQSKAHGHERDFINLDGLKTPLFKEFHNLGKFALHSNVGLCPLPSKELRYIMREALYEVAGDNVYDKFLFVSEQVQALGKYSLHPGISRSARQVGKNMLAQSPYILNGMVREL